MAQNAKVDALVYIMMGSIHLCFPISATGDVYRLVVLFVSFYCPSEVCTVPLKIKDGMGKGS